MSVTRPKLELALIAIASASAVILLVSFASEMIRAARNYTTAVRVVASILAPAPVILFAFFAMGRRAGPREPGPPANPRTALVLFFGTIGATVVLARLLQGRAAGGVLAWQIPLCINSYVYAFNLVNTLAIRNLHLSSVLSALSLGITVCVLFG